MRPSATPPLPRLARRAVLLLGAAALAPLALGPTPARAQEGAPAVTPIGPDDLALALEAKDFVLINVHVPYEGEIAGTDAFIPFDRIGADTSALPQDRAAEIVLYCLSGRMSAIAGERLAALGYSRVSDLAGGMNAWVASGRELVAR